MIIICGSYKSKSKQSIILLDSSIFRRYINCTHCDINRNCILACSLYLITKLNNSKNKDIKTRE